MRDTRVLLERQQTIGALQDFTAELQPVLRQVGDLERILARLALRIARPRDGPVCATLSSNCRSCVRS
ncbi:hypothetical protein ACLBR5_09610 [Escherichia coli]